MLYLPEKCPRGFTDCVPYNQIVSDDNVSFFCCGENDGTSRELEQDKYTLCFKNNDVDELNHNDKRDLIHQASVILGALSIIEEAEVE